MINYRDGTRLQLTLKKIDLFKLDKNRKNRV